MIVAALLRAVPDVLLPGVRSVLLLSLLLTALVFALLGALLWLGLGWLFAWAGWTQIEGFASATLAALTAIACGWLLFRAVAMGVIGLFADRIVSAVEAADYPGAHTAARPVPFVAGLRVSVRSLVRALFWNLAALPLYLALLVTGVGTALLFLVLNGYLLGRDLAELIEPRHPGIARFSRAARWQLGLVSALLFLVPVANLFAPVLSVAMAVHLFHRREALAS